MLLDHITHLRDKPELRHAKMVFGFECNLGYAHSTSTTTLIKLLTGLHFGVIGSKRNTQSTRCNATAYKIGPR